MARELEMSRGQRLDLGDRLEEVKASGGGGTKNARGDFTMRELRAEARESSQDARGPATEQATGRAASLSSAERGVGALAGTELLGARFTYGDELDVRFGDATPHAHPRVRDSASRGWVLRLRSASWVLVCDEEPIARSGDEPAHVLTHLGELEGRMLTQAQLRRRDAAITLGFEEELCGERFELVVRGRPARHVRATRWELATPDGLLVVAYGDGSVSVGPDASGGWA